MKRAGIMRIQDIEHPIRSIGGRVLRSSDLNGGGRNFSADHPGEMVCQITRLRSVAATEVDERKLWVGIVPKQRQILFSRMSRIGVPKDFAGGTAQRTPKSLP